MDYRTIASFCSALLLTACTGSGGSDSDASASDSASATTASTLTGGTDSASTTSATTTSATAATDSGSTGSTTATTTTGATDSNTGPVFDVGQRGDLGGGDDGGPVDESTCEKAAENLTSAGCLFAPVIMQVSGSLPWAVVAANTNVADATVTLRGVDGVMIEQSVIAPGELHTFILQGGSALYNQHNVPEQTGQSARTLRLEADIPVVAYQFSPYSSSQQATSDASILLPYHAWGLDYVVGAYKNTDSSAAWVTIASFDDDNLVEVTTPTYLTGSTAAGGPLPAMAAGESAMATLADGDVLRVYSTGASTADPTGIRVTSSKPVSVFTGAPSMSIPGPGFVAYKDHLEEQQLPRTAWGKEYAVVHFRPRSTEDDLYRFIADKDGTEITLSGDYNDLLMLNEGEFAEVRTAESFYAAGTEPFAVYHYMYSQSQTPGPKNDTEYPGLFLSPNCANPSQATTELGDPAVSFFPPVAQYRRNYTFLTPETYAWDMVTVIGPETGWGSILLDGAPLPEAPTPLGVAGLGYARLLIEDGPHEIHSDAVKFGLEVYGYDCRVSYAFPGGLSLAEINPPEG